MMKSLNLVPAALVFAWLLPAPLAAQTVLIPNSSFESPATEFVTTRIAGWQKVPKPEWFVESESQQWDQLSGLFLNSQVGSDGHIANLDAKQALYLFAVPSVGLFQDYDSIDHTSPDPSHAFDAIFEPGKAYRLTAGLIGGGGGMREGASLMLSFYHRQDPASPATVAFTNVVHSTGLFPTTTAFVDVSLTTPVVKPSDPWAGKHIGVSLLSTILDPSVSGGYWDVDNIRLEAIPGPPSAEVGVELRGDGSIRVFWTAVAGFEYQLKSSEDLAAWVAEETPAIIAGTVLSKIYPAAGAARFFTVEVSAASQGVAGVESGWNVFSVTMTMMNPPDYISIPIFSTIQETTAAPMLEAPPMPLP